MIQASEEFLSVVKKFFVVENKLMNFRLTLMSGTNAAKLFWHILHTFVIS